MPDTKAKGEMHGCIVCGKLYQLLIAYDSNGKYIGSKVMNYSIDEIGHLNEYLMSNNIQSQHLENIKILGEKIEDISYNFANQSDAFICKRE